MVPSVLYGRAVAMVTRTKGKGNAMTVTLVRDETDFTRTFVYEVGDWPRQTHPDYREIQPRLVKITLHREKEEPWRVSWVLLTGPLILASGKVGKREMQHAYTFKEFKEVDPYTPDHLVDLVRDTLERAERDRTGVE